MPPHTKLRTPLPDEAQIPGDFYPQCGNPQCPFEKEKDNWLDAKFLKVSGVIIALLSPMFVWIVLSIGDIKTEQAVQKQKIELFIDIKNDINSIKNDIGQLKTDVAILKSKGNP